MVSAAGAYGGIACPAFGSSSTSARLTIVGNVVRSCTNAGVYLEDGAQSMVEGNRVSGCAIGCAVNGAYAANVRFGINDFEGNTARFAGSAPTSTFDLGVSLLQGAASSGAFYPATPALAPQSAASLFAGTGAPSNSTGNNGDLYFRSDGRAGATIYQRRAGTWVGIV